MVTIVTDSSVDLPPAVAEQLGIVIAPLSVAFADENLHDTGLDRAEFYRRADRDGDGRISYPEFHHWSKPNLVRNGIPARWQEEIRSWMSPDG